MLSEREQTEAALEVENRKLDHLFRMWAASQTTSAQARLWLNYETHLKIVDNLKRELKSL